MYGNYFTKSEAYYKYYLKEGYYMKKILKKISYLLLTMLLFVFCFKTTTAKNLIAGTGETKEIEVNQSVSAYNGASNEEIFYKFTLNEAGMIRLEFENKLQNTYENYWEIKIYDDSNNLLFQKKIDGGLDHFFPEMGLKAGEYYVSIKLLNSEVSSDEYSFKVNYTKSINWEKESNDSFDQANLIAVNKDYYGATTRGYSYEKDYYSFELKKPGMVEVELKNDYFSEDHADSLWHVELYSNDSTPICIDSMVIKGNDTDSRLPEIGLPAGKYYVVVYADSYEYADTWKTYNIKVNYKESDYWEKENNDDFTTATKIKVNKEYYGSLTSGYEYELDYYSFSLSNPGMVTVSLKMPVIGSVDATCNVVLYDENRNKITSGTMRGNYSYLVLVTEGLPKGNYFVLVESDAFEYCINQKTYTLNVNYEKTSFCEKEFNDSISTSNPIKIGYQYTGTTDDGYLSEHDYYSFKVTKNGNYFVYLSGLENGNKSVIWNAKVYDSKNNLLNTVESIGSGKVYAEKFNLKKGTYYINVESNACDYAMSTEPYYVFVIPESEDKKIDKIFQSFVDIKSINAGTKKITIKCNKPDFSGMKYEVQYKVDGGEWKSMIVNGSKYNGISVSKLTSGKTYKVRVRAYYKYSGSVYTGRWSAVKKVKVK